MSSHAFLWEKYSSDEYANLSSKFDQKNPTTFHLIFSIQIARKIFRFCRHDAQFQDKHVPLNHMSAV